MHCPSCRADDTKVIDSREADEGASIRRRRMCPLCSHRFTTFERLEELPLSVVKTHGGRQPFDRAKVTAGIRSACKGRPCPRSASSRSPSPSRTRFACTAPR